MGAMDFTCRAKGKTALTAFRIAVAEAEYEYGHGGYTGTIAEKSEYTLIPVPDGKDPIEFARALMEKDDPRIADKWGPAGCVRVNDGEYFFFGWASS